MKKLTTNLEFLRKTMVKMGIALVFCSSIFLFFSFTGFDSIIENEAKNDPFNYYLEDTSTECRLRVDAGSDVTFCEGGGDVTLTARASGAAECCVQFDIVNTQQCGTNKRYVLWLSDGRGKTKSYRDGGLSWREYPNGTATLKGKVRNIRNNNDILFVDVTYSGKRTTPPAGSPKGNWCNDINTRGWEYYTKIQGTIKKLNGSWSTEVSRRGPVFQLGNGANSTEKNRGRLGGSGWINTTDNVYKIGDFNFNLGYCEVKAGDTSYLWSTGETTPTITVKEPGTYTVEVKDCKNCVATDEVKVEKINLQVDSGIDQEVCKGDEITITAEVSGASECCVQFDIVNTQHCKNDKRYVLWLSDGGNNTRYYRDGGLSWREYPNGTATLKGPVRNIRNHNDILYVDVTYSGRTTLPPAGSPKNHWCNNENPEGWQYYTEVTGTIKKRNNSWWSFNISERGPAFQLGKGANITEKNKKRLGASGWFNTTHSKYKIGDFNFNLGYCEEKSSEVSYLWSTGETTQTITVDEPGTYSVEVKDCENCVATDEVEVKEINLEVDAGEDEEICKGDEVTLTATVDADAECKECVEYGITDTETCTGNGRKYVLWIYNPATTAGRYFTNVDLVWKQEDDGTATLKGKVYSSVLNQNYVVDVIFSGQTNVPPTEESPKDHFCYDEDATSWAYYPEYSGTITSEDGTWSTNISRVGPAFQLGEGANTNEIVEGRYGASGWFNTTDGEFTFGDFNINLDCIKYEPKGIEYLWSTGETTQSITVSPEVDTTYEVTISGCGDCTASDTVDVIVKNPPQVDAGEDQNICKGEEIVLNATVEGEGECEVCVEYGITDTEMCTGNGREYAVWVYNSTTTAGRFFTNVDLVWSQNDNGTATLKGNVYYNVLDEYYELDVTFTGRTSIPPSESPKDHFCYEENASGWEYYTEYTGTISQIGGTWSVVISNVGPAFQVGNGANTNEMVEGRYGASGWFEMENSEFDFGDININLDCIKYEPKGIEYLWSTGETTQSITVSPEEDTTYEVAINGCTDCGEDTDTIEVTVINCEGVRSNSEELQNATIYPTLLSSNSTLYVDLSNGIEDQDVNIAIYDITGIEVGSTTNRFVSDNDNISIDLSQYRVSKGIYVVRIVGNNWVKTERIVISNQ